MTPLRRPPPAFARLVLPIGACLAILLAVRYLERASADEVSSGSTGAARRADAASATPASAEMALLFLSPGGAYTVADIAANGHETAWRRYAGVRARPRSVPAPGEAVCPVTRARADSRFTWVVGGRPHSFCCLPCIGTYVRRAKGEEVVEATPEVNGADRRGKEKNSSRGRR